MTLEPRELPVKTHGSQSIIWWGMVMLVVIEISLFSLLIAGYFFLKIRSPAWPPEGIDNPSLLLPTIYTVVLVLSGVAQHFADTASKKGERRRLITWQAVALVLAALFLVLKFTEYSNLPYQWDTHVYGSITWTISGFHSLHVISVFLKGLLVWYMGYIGTYTPRSHLAVEVNGLYWQFVVVIWLPLYFTMYLSPYLF